MTAGGGSETEIKVRLSGSAQGRKLMKTSGFKRIRGRVFESNTLYDTDQGRLRDSDMALRIRQAGKRWTLTLKSRADQTQVHKSRQEIELEIADGASMAALLDRLGYAPKFRYDKFRTEYEKDGGLAMLDETPMGVFLELEGAPEWIDRTAAALGFRQEEYITASYPSLYRGWRELHPDAPDQMIFQRSEGLRVR